MELPFINRPRTKIPENEAILEMADFLIERGFRPSEALEVSERFWTKHRRKLERVV